MIIGSRAPRGRPKITDEIEKPRCVAVGAEQLTFIISRQSTTGPPHLVRRARGLVEVAEEQNDWRCSSSLGIRVHLLQQLAHQR